MYEEEIHFGKLLLKQSETVLTYLTLMILIFDPVIKIKSINQSAAQDRCADQV